jgi:guanine deaminase
LFPRADEPRFDLVEDALVAIDDRGRISAAGPAPADCPVGVSHPGAVLLPGFVDAHVHFPQTRVLGSASGPLLDWLARSVFPEEARFSERAYAEAVASEFCERLIAQGTTTAAIYSTSHLEATDALFAALDRSGLRGLAGLTLMDRAAPPALVCGKDAALEACSLLHARWHGHDDGRLRFSVIPRFALSCTPELLGAAGELAARLDLTVQTHLSENRQEVRATLEAFPGAADYLAVYERYGLVGERTVFAHCIWLSDGEWDRLARAGATVAHCPDSNFFLGSGCMSLAKATRRGCRVGLGTDVGAGRTFSPRRVAAAAYDAALVVDARVAPEALLWHATAGGARALGLDDKIGRIAPGYEADLVALEAPPLTGEALIDSLVFRHDAGPARATYVRGRRLGTA